MRLSSLLQRSVKFFRIKNVIPKKSAWGNVKPEMTDCTIVECFFCGTTLHYNYISYNNSIIP
jgi:hypothetical protein